MERLFNWLGALENFYWSYIGVWLLIGVGVYLTIRTRFFQFRVLQHLPAALHFMVKDKSVGPGISPLKVLLMSAGGTIGIGNIVAVVTALQIGGPGALLWLWVGVLFGTLIKYSEIYLGMKYRRSKGDKGYDGSLVHAYPSAFRWPWLSRLLVLVCAVLLCFYGIEIYQFTVITDTFVQCFPFVQKEWITAGFLGLIFYVGMGGIRRLSMWSSTLMPLLIIFYTLLCCIIVLLNFKQLPHLLFDFVKSAFVGYAPLGGFAGSTILLGMHQGFARGVYSSDIAIGFDSILHGESRVNDPRKQACIAVLGTLMDAFVCSCTFVVVYLGGFWRDSNVLSASDCILKTFSHYFSLGPYFLSAVIFLAGFTTIQAYFVVGLKMATFLSQKWGKRAYFLLAAFNFSFFSYYDQSKVLTLMMLAAGFLISINISCILLLRKQIYFNLDGCFKDCTH